MVRTNSVTNVALAMQVVASLAVNGKATLSLANMGGFLFVINTLAQLAIFTAQGGGHATQLISDPSAAYSITAATANKTNIYWSGTVYEIENKTAGVLSYYISFLGN